MRHASIELSDYRSIRVGAGDIVYADPPYAQTTPYEAVKPFSTDEFWVVADAWVDAGATVLVSEHVAPDSWHCAWSKPTPAYLRGDQSVEFRTESVFIKTPAGTDFFAAGVSRIEKMEISL